MKLRDLNLGDILLIDGKPYNRTGWFDCESSDGDIYYRLHGADPFKRFTGHEVVTHFSDNVFMLEQEAAGQ